jgi:pimeloyl-ACP methyl ester carboxylesterase
METLTAHHGAIDIAYQCFGCGGDPLLLVMGIAADMLYWHDDFCAALVDNGFQVVRFDNRDSGESTHLHWAGTPNRRRVRRHPDTAPYRLEDMADDAAALLDALGWSSAHVVGHSMGGMIAQTLATCHPHRVQSLTCISSTPSPDIGRPTPLTLLRLLLANPAAMTGRPPRGPAEAAERMVHGHRVIGSPGYPLDEAWLRRIGELMYARGGFDLAGRARQGAAILASGDRRPALANLRIPTLVLHGQADCLVRPDGGYATAATIPGATLETLPGMGHDLPRALWPTIIQQIRALANTSTQTKDDARESQAPYKCSDS